MDGTVLLIVLYVGSTEELQVISVGRVFCAMFVIWIVYEFEGLAMTIDLTLK